MRPQAPVRGRVASTVAMVATVTQLTPRMTRVRLVDDSLVGLAAIPGQTLKIYVPDLVGELAVSRDYTVRDYTLDDDGARPRLDIDFVLHGEGPAANWARRVRPGETLEFVGPSGRYRPDPHADWHLFAGDETALPAIQTYLGDAAGECLRTGLRRSRRLRRGAADTGSGPADGVLAAPWRPRARDHHTAG